MMMPGFTAESALYQTRERYRATAGAAATGGGLQPAMPHCNFLCLDNCESSCDFCDELPIRSQAACHARCDARCARRCCHQ